MNLQGIVTRIAGARVAFRIENELVDVDVLIIAKVCGLEVMVS